MLACVEEKGSSRRAEMRLLLPGASASLRRAVACGGACAALGGGGAALGTRRGPCGGPGPRAAAPGPAAAGEARRLRATPPQFSTAGERGGPGAGEPAGPGGPAGGAAGAPRGLAGKPAPTAVKYSMSMLGWWCKGSMVPS